MKKLYLLVMTFLLPAALYSQEHSHNHPHERNEIGISGGAIYTLDHKTWGAGAHIHYFRTLGPHSKWAWGTNLEYVSADGDHFTIGAGMKFFITHSLSVSAMPGVTFYKHKDHDHHEGEGHDHDHGHSDKKAAFSAHLEVVYDLFHWGNFHLGPVADFSWAKDDSHLMLGVHFAYAF